MVYKMKEILSHAGAIKLDYSVRLNCAGQITDWPHINISGFIVYIIVLHAKQYAMDANTYNHISLISVAP